MHEQERFHELIVDLDEFIVNFINENLDPDRVLYDSDEVEVFIRKAVLTKVRDDIRKECLKIIAMMDQEAAKFED